jgi:hypothetical protein
MKRIAKVDWDRVHELACEIANATGQDDDVLAESKTEALMCVLKELEGKYGVCSRITATIADYAEDDRQLSLYREALSQAKAEGDVQNEKLILDSLAEIGDEKRASYEGSSVKR